MLQQIFPSPLFRYLVDLPFESSISAQWRMPLHPSRFQKMEVITVRPVDVSKDGRDHFVKFHRNRLPHPSDAKEKTGNGSILNSGNSELGCDIDDPSSIEILTFGQDHGAVSASCSYFMATA